MSGDWWRGSVAGKEGLIPDKYILIKIRYDSGIRDRTTRMKLIIFYPPPGPPQQKNALMLLNRDLAL